MSVRITTDLDVGDVEEDLGRLTKTLKGDLWRW